MTALAKNKINSLARVLKNETKKREGTLIRTEEKINENIKYYRKIRDKAQKDRRFRTVEGAQWNIDNCMDELYKLKKDKTT
jgi:hypothetical protein